MEKLKDRVAIVTGAGSGIGRAIALAMAEEGATLLLSDINRDSLQDTVDRMEAAGIPALGVTCDVSKKTDVRGMVDSCLARFSRIDILVNNAGGSGDKTYENFWDEESAEAGQKIIDTNLKGCIYCSMAVVPQMINQRYGKMINIASQAGRYASELADPYYAASKGGQLAFTRQMALKLGPYGIYVNAIAPGITLSGPRLRRKWQELNEDERQLKLRNIPLGRLGTSEEQARVAIFLASDDSSYITGATIDANGGRFMA